MTPERLNELADEIQSADEVELLEGELLERVIIALRESAQALTCAKAEPVAVVIEWDDEHRPYGQLLKEIPNGTKLYAHPPKQEQSPIDERAEFERYFHSSKYCQVVNPSAQNYQIAFDGWQARAKLSAPKVAIVPDEKDEIDHDEIWTNADVAEARYIQGWNDCRAAMLKEAK